MNKTVRGLISGAAKANCSIKNEGNSNLQDVEYCVGSHCQHINLLINQHYNLSIDLQSDSVGWKTILVTAKNNQIEKKTSIDYKVLDPPKIKVQAQAPAQVEYGTDFEIALNARKTSFSSAQQVTITIKGNGFQNTWAIDDLEAPQDFKLNIDGKRISFSNGYTITTRWEDVEGNQFSEITEVNIEGVGKTFSDKVKMLFNKIAGWFY